MVRTQIQLTEEQSDTLHAIARQKKISVSKLISISIDNLIQSHSLLDYEQKKKNAIAATSKIFRSGKKDISINHDQYFVESL